MVQEPPTSQVRYITNAAGETTDVLISLELWQQVLTALHDSESGLAWVDEHEPKAKLLNDLKTALKQATNGQCHPVSELWANLET